MRTACVLALLAAVSVAVCAAPAVAGKGGNPGKGGNSNAAHSCQHGGWRNWVRADQTPFKNTGACVSYVARGGTLTKRAAQLLCESLGGVFAPGSGKTLWYCTYTYSNAAFNALAHQCLDLDFPPRAGGRFGIVSGNSSGVRTDECRLF